MIKEWTVQQIRDFVKKDYQSVAARMTKCLLQYYDEVAPKPVLCDGCNVREPHEHRCHGNNIVIRGEHTDKKCECDFETCKMIQH